MKSVEEANRDILRGVFTTMLSEGIGGPKGVTLTVLHIMACWVRDQIDEARAGGDEPTELDQELEAINGAILALEQRTQN